MKSKFSRGGLFHIKTRASLKYDMNVCSFINISGRKKWFIYIE